MAELTRIPPPNSRDLSWSADGQWLAVSAPLKVDRGEAHGLYLVKVESRQMKQVTFPANQEEDGFPSFSWGGSRLTFTRDVGRGVSVNMIVQLNSAMSPVGDPARVEEGFEREFCGYPVWTPDDRNIVFSSNKGGLYRLWIVPTGKPRYARLLGSLGSDIQMPAISSKGQLAFAHNAIHWSIWKLDLQALRSGKTVAPVQVIHSTRNAETASVSPEGKKLVFSSDRSGFWEIWRSNLDGSAAVPLTAMNSVGVGSPNWSPNGMQIAFDSRVSGKPEIYVTDADGRDKPVRITNNSGVNVIPHWSPDGRYIYFSSKISGSDQIWRISADGKTSDQITKTGGFAALPSLDGKILYYMKDRSPVSELWQVNLENREEKLVLPAILRRGFAPTKDSIYYFSTSSHGSSVLNYYQLSSRTSRELLELHSTVRLSPGLTPDGQTLFYGQLDLGQFRFDAREDVLARTNIESLTAGEDGS